MHIDLEDALERVEEMRDADSDEGVANALMRLGLAYVQRKKLNLAAEAFDETHYICKKLENIPGQAQVCLHMAEVEMGRNQLDPAGDWLAKALKLFREIKDVSGQIDSLEMQSQLMLRLGREKEAISRLKQALDILEKHGGDEIAKVLVLTHLASIHRYMANWDQAGRTYQQVLDLSYALGDQDRTAFALVGVGTCLVLSGKVEEGNRALGEAEELYQKLGQISRAEQVRAEMERLGAASAKNQQAEDDS